MKRVKFAKKLLLYFIIVQIIILALFSLLAIESKPINISDCMQKDITVEKTEYRLAFREYQFSVFANDVQYKFPNLVYTNNEPNKKIEASDSLTITYVRKLGFFGKYNLIIDARNGDNVYLDSTSYNEQSEVAFLLTIILSCVVEFVFLGAIIIIIIFNFKDLKLVTKKRK